MSSQIEALFFRNKLTMQHAPYAVGDKIIDKIQ
jgi:hypothetical protein